MIAYRGSAILNFDHLFSNFFRKINQNSRFGINHVFEFTIFTNLEKTEAYAAKRITYLLIGFE
jgi:hypothetical protein